MTGKVIPIERGRQLRLARQARAIHPGSASDRALLQAVIRELDRAYAMIIADLEADKRKER